VNLHQTAFTSTSGNANAALAKNPNSQISFGGMGAALNPTPAAHNLNLQARPQPPQDQFAHLYTHAQAHQQGHIQGMQSSGPAGGGYQSSSLQPAASEDERAYARYAMASSGASPVFGAAAGSGASGRPLTATADRGPAANAAPRQGRRPQSALDRVPQATTQQPAQSHHNSAANHSGGRTSPTPPAGLSTGLYTAELKSLMGSAAYNRPLSAPNKHHVETLNAYTEATKRMKEKEERAKTTKDKLEQVYLGNQRLPDGTVLPAPSQAGQRHGAGAVAESKGVPNYGNNPSYRPQSAMQYSTQPPAQQLPTAAQSQNYGNPRWGATTPHAASNTNNNTGMSAVDRALSIGRTNSGFFNNNNQSAHAPAATAQGRNERARSAGRGMSSNNLASSLGRALPLDSHAKQARLSEMYDDAILEKLDGAVGMGRR
jgi:hypothetical protein